MKIYLAGPMRGLPDFNFPEFFRYAYLLREEGNEVFNPAEIGIHQDNIREIFAVEMDWLCREAEAVALMPGWSESLGARAEAAIARALDLKIIGVPGFHPTRPLESHFPSGRRSSITSPSPSRKLPRYHSPDKDNTEPPAGTARKALTRLMPSFVTTWTVGLLIAMACYILARWLGAH